jgi:glutathione S-transferase
LLRGLITVADYRLYAHRNSYAMTTHLMLEELGVDYNITWFNVHKPEEFPPEFLDLNPNAKVPVLVTPDGVVYESAATLLYLSEHHDNRFMPVELGAQRARAQQWLIYLMSTFQPEVMIQFHAERYFPDDVSMQQALRTASLRELELLWTIIEDALDPGPWLLGETYSICDVLFVMQAIWKENQPADLSKLPNSVRLLKTAFERPAVQRVMAIHQIENLADL